MRWQVQLLCRAAEVSPCLEHLLLGGLFVKAYKHGSGVAVRNGNTEALRSDRGLLGVDNLIALDVAPQLQRLALALLFLTADVGDDVIYESRASGQRSCLHRKWPDRCRPEPC